MEACGLCILDGGEEEGVGGGHSVAGGWNGGQCSMAPTLQACVIQPSTQGEELLGWQTRSPMLLGGGCPGSSIEVRVKKEKSLLEIKTGKTSQRWQNVY